MKQHIVLVGLPGAGKTTVGRLLAERLGAGFIDVDNVIVRKIQMPVARYFAEFGEPKFRELEREAMAAALNGEPAIIAPGGGWAAQPTALEEAKANSLVVYLRCLAMIAAKRAGNDGTRPLLVGEDPVEKMRVLLKEREPFYLQAHVEVKADVKAPEALADEIAELARTRAGW